MNSKIKINKLDKKSLSDKSKQWLKNHINDPFVRKAQKDGYISRAAYKLIEIQERFKLIQKSHNIIELGSSPGGWSQVLTTILHTGKIFAIDLLPMKFVNHKISFIQGDFLNDSEKIIEKINFYSNNSASSQNEHEENIDQNLLSLDEKIFLLKANLIKNSEKSKIFNTNDTNKNIIINGILSDMCPNSSGDNMVDHWRIIDLCENALKFAKSHLAPGGYFICKIFFGGEEKDFANLLKQNFKSIHFFKPSSSRKQSSEIYIVAKNFFL